MADRFEGWVDRPKGSAQKAEKAAAQSALVVIREDNSRQILEALDSGLMAGLDLVGFQAEKHAKAACPVDTGRLRNSITHALNSGEKAVYIGSNVEYAPYVELGTSRRPQGAHMLRDAAQGHADEYGAILRRAMNP